MNSKKWFKSSTAMILASLVVVSGAAAVTTNIAETANITASAISVHEFQISSLEAYNPNGGSIRIDSPVKFRADLSNALTNYNSYTSNRITIKKDGAYQANIAYDEAWYPKTAGTYTAEIYVVDYYGNYGSKTISFYVKNPGKPQITTFNVVPVSYSGALRVGSNVKFETIIQEGGENFTGIFSDAKIVITKSNVTHATLDVKDGMKEWFPKEQGRYSATYSFTTPSGRSASRTIDFDVNPRASDAYVDSFTATTPSGKYCVGVPVKFDYKVSNCYTNSYGRYSYAAVRILKDGKQYAEVDVNATVDPKNWTWTPTETGSYVLQFCITDGYIGEKHATYSIGINVTARLGAKMSVSKTSLTLGQTLTITGGTTGGAGTKQYAYYYKKKGEASWKTIKGFSSATSTTFKPTSAGDYQFMVHVKDANGASASTYKDVTVKSKLVNNSTVSATKIKVNNSVTVTGKASGGAGSYQYAMYYKLSTDSKYTTARGYSTTASKSIKFTKAGTYTILIKVKDKNGMIVDRTRTVTVTA